ncbi:hypothetical protein [Nostoc sp. PA-18-2419]|uniref:hypothetical protein n=1 Tax=Nostoc sp. PA-18-2419 TaxID=2575443 RepID=UPI001109C6C2|nr:hypothetical protein [Nostoc sp. PA-18-2419]
MAQKTVDVPDPVGSDGPGGAAQAPNANQYHVFRVKSTKHEFVAPKNKYSDLLDVLGLEDVDSNDAAKEQGVRLAQGYGYIHLKVKVKGGGSLMVVCDPDQVGNALKNGKSKKIYGKDIDRIYIPKKRVLI